jgi:hypothetical protein
MKTSLIQIYVLGLLLAITFSQQAAVTDITLPPNFVVITENFTLYYEFNANTTVANSTGNNTSGNVTNATTPPTDATNATTPPTTTTPPTDVTNTTTPPTAATDTSNNATNSSQNNSQTIDLYMVFQGHNWFGLGFSVNNGNNTIVTTDTTIAPATAAFDLVVVEIVNETIVVSDHYSPIIGLPIPDTNQGGKNDWTLVNYSMNATIMVVHVTRLQNTGDPLDAVITGPGNYSLLWLWSPSLTLQGFQGDGGRGITNATLVDTNATATNGTAVNGTQQLNSIAGGSKAVCNMTLCPNGSNSTNPICSGCTIGNHGIRLGYLPISFILGVLWCIL